MSRKIKTWRDPCGEGFSTCRKAEIEIFPGTTVLVGCNGAGKLQEFVLAGRVNDKARRLLDALSSAGRTDRADIPKHLLARLTELFGTPEAEELFEQKFGESEMILFGEGFGEKIQSNGANGNYINGVDFALFDVYCPGQDLWLTRDSVQDIATAFGLQVPDTIFEGTIDDAISFVKCELCKEVTLKMSAAGKHIIFCREWSKSRNRLLV